MPSQLRHSPTSITYLPKINLYLRSVFSEKLITLLRTFGKIELNRLRKFITSPYFNEEADVVQVFDFYQTQTRKSPESLDTLTKEQVWKKIWPTQPFDDAHLRRMASDLTQLAIRFRAVEYREQSPVTGWLDQQIALETPGLDKHLSGIERQMIRYFEETEGRNTHFYLYHFQYYWNIFNRSYRVVAATDYMGRLLPADQFLDFFYVVQKLKIYIAWLSYKQFRNTDKEIVLPPGFWEHIQDAKFEQAPMVAIYRQVIRTLLEPTDEVLFQELLDILETAGHTLADEDLRECYFIAQNYCALKINQGKHEYYMRAFEIFRQMDTRKVLLEKGQLAEGIYKNVITSGLRAGQFEWVERFIENMSAYLPSTIRENARAYNLANLYSHQRQYDKAMRVLQSVEYTDVTYAMGAKTILLRIYYEQGEYMALDSLIDSFRIYLRRNQQISKNLQKEMNNFLNLVKKLTTLRVGDQQALEDFHQKVKATSYNTPKKWLLDKIAELRR